MTIKEYVLDALEKLWDKIKADYIDALAARATALEQKTAVQTTTATLGGKNIYLRKQGNVVTVYFNTITPETAIAAEAETAFSGVIPSGYRPAAQQVFLVVSSATATSGKMIQIAFQTNGNVVFYNWSSSGVGPSSGWIRGCFTYICA